MKTAGTLAALACLTFAACSEPDDYETASATATTAVELPAFDGQWYVGNSDFTECIPASKSPAERIQESRDAGDTPITKDVLDSNGSLIAVEVAVSVSYGLEERFWVYYRSDAACIAALAAQNDIPDRYQ